MFSGYGNGKSNIGPSFLSNGRRIENVAVYKYKFGKECMKREMMEAAPQDVFIR